MKIKSKESFFILLIFLLAFLFRIFAINWQLPYLYQTEEYKTVNYTLKMAAERSLNPKFFEYPSLYLYFMLFVYGCTFFIGKILGYYISAEDFAIKFFKDPTAVYVIGRIFSAVFGSIVVVLSYIFGKKLYNRTTGLFSAIIIAILPIWVVYSHFIKPEMASNCLVVLYAISLYRFHLYEKTKDLYLSCIFLGLATSMKYLSLPAGILLLVVFYYKRNKISVNFVLLSGLLIILSFIIGTPYSILDNKTFLKEILGIIKGPDGGLKRQLLYGFLTTLHNWIFMGNKTPVIGLICFAGIIKCMLTRKFEDVLLISIFLVYTIVNMTHYFPAWGFLFTAFPFYAVAGGRLIDELLQKNKIVAVVLILFLLLPFVESIIIDISFYLKDTRTIALEWIEKNVPQGSKILIDRYPNSPPLKMTKEQLEKLYKKAVELNHYKKEYFYWQLKAYSSEDYSYEIYEVYHPPHEISTIKAQVEEAQKVKELVNVICGIDELRKMGIKYFIHNSYSKEIAKQNPELKNFYDKIENNTRLIKEFVPKTKLHPGPVIRIYEL